MFKRIQLRFQIALVLIVAMVLTHPLTAPFVMNAIFWVFDNLIDMGMWVMLVGGFYLIGLIFWLIHESGRTKTAPKASKRPKDGLKYEVTN